MILRLYNFFLNYKLTCFLIDILSWLYRSITIKNIDPKILENKEGIKDYNIDKNWFYKSKKKGISGIARLKNADDFLENVIESYIDFLDELILVDNQSSDDTWKICKKMQLQYPNKIKLFSYEYDVVGAISETPPPSNSIHSLAYYYNWCFAKSKYQYVMKVDDDNLMIPEKIKEIREYILLGKNRRYSIFHGINLIKSADDIAISGDIKYAGLYGDHGIYPSSPKTYYLQGKRCEIFKNPYLYKRFGLSYFHLKFLKKNMGCTNYGDKNKTFKNISGFKKFLNIGDFVESKETLKYLHNKI